ncbi:hypothetical protein LUZ61_009908 [Rhynchospora tenuis]|uniref:C2H2-type domain-containing protein n=1 Tax=Rhynchospora tenuis TaxID=198213 RepID=A0AAD5ZYA1_9POAL|nr:hypothetical protein LUZ61_009908 [Rhynchospora tenuis]
MAATTLLQTPDRYTRQPHQHQHPHHSHRRRHKKLPPPAPQPQPSPPVSSWEHFKSLLSCRSLSSVHIVAPSSNAKPPIASRNVTATGTGICGTSLCALRDVVHGNTRVVHRSDNTDSASAASVESVGSIGSASCKETAPLARNARQRRHGHSQSQDRSLSSGCGGFQSKGGGGMPLRGLTGCVECRAVSVEPMSRRYPRPRALCVCPDCGEVFTKPESLEHHQATRHAVSELGPEDSGRNIVEIIFKSSWHQAPSPSRTPSARRPVCHIDRILKVHNAPRTLARFEAHRATVKSRSSARAAADGNELLRFLPAPISCALGLNGSNSLCGSSACGVCSAIRHGFTPPAQTGVRTTASSGRAHDALNQSDNLSGLNRAMVVCRVIAGRVMHAKGGAEAGAEADGYDSVAGDANLEEMFVMNPRAILPCFVVIYRTIN